MTVRLADPWFEAGFYGHVTSTGWRHGREDGAQLSYAESQGLFLWCPCGYGKRDEHGIELFPLDLSLNKGRPHLVIVPFANPPCGIELPADHGPVGRDGKSHPRWTVSGSGIDDLTLAPSIDVGEPSCWHGYIRTGEVTR